MSYNPKKLRRAVLKEEFVALLGDPKSAMVLNQMIYWSERISDFDDFISEEIKRAEAEGIEIGIEPQNGWFYKTVADLGEELMGLVSRNVLLEMLETLVTAGYLSKRKNPRYRWDRTNQYRVNIVAIQRDLQRIGYALEGYRFNIAAVEDRLKTVCEVETVRTAKHSPNLDVPMSKNGFLKVQEWDSNTKDYIQRLNNVPIGSSKDQSEDKDTDTRTPDGGAPVCPLGENKADKEQGQRGPAARHMGKAENAKRFAKFWETYPKKRAKGCAEEAWCKINPDEQLLKVMLSAIEQARQTKEWHAENGRYIPHPAAWLKARRWEDEYDVAGAKGGSLDGESDAPATGKYDWWYE